MERLSAETYMAERAVVSEKSSQVAVRKVILGKQVTAI